MNVKRRFLLLFLTIFIILSLANICSVNDYNLTDIINIIIIIIINIGISYSITEVILSFLGRKVDLPKLGKLAVYPPVALLYVTYNDVLPKAVNTLERQSYLNYDIFILDDSTDEICKRFLDTIGYKIIRRDNRKGYKAGALNNWLNLYGNIYKYFIISDADSIFEDDF